MIMILGVFLMRKVSVLLITVCLLLVGCVEGNAEKTENTKIDESGIPVVLYHHLLNDDENTNKENNMIL